MAVLKCCVLLVIGALYITAADGQVKIEDKKSGGDGAVWRKGNETEAEDEREIYTSMHELTAFFAREREYVEDLRAVMERKLVSVDARGAVGAYVSSYEDVVGEQEEDESFLHNPLNVYALVRHVAVGWGIVEEALRKEGNRQKGGGGNLGS